MERFDCTQKFYTVLEIFPMLKNFRQFYFQALFLSKFKIVQTFLEVIYDGLNFFVTTHTLGRKLLT